MALDAQTRANLNQSLRILSNAVELLQSRKLREPQARQCRDEAVEFLRRIAAQTELALAFEPEIDSHGNPLPQAAGGNGE